MSSINPENPGNPQYHEASDAGLTEQMVDLQLENPERTKSPRRGMCAAVLTLEAISVGLVTPVLISVNDIAAGPSLAVGLGLFVLCILAAGMLSRRGGYALGWIIQVLAIGLGFVVPMMFVVGLIYGGLWASAYLLGIKIERERAAAWAAWDAAEIERAAQGDIEAP